MLINLQNRSSVTQDGLRPSISPISLILTDSFQNGPLCICHIRVPELCGTLLTHAQSTNHSPNQCSVNNIPCDEMSYT